MSAALQKRPPSVITSATSQMKTLNAELVTAIATSFLKRIGHKNGLKPKRVSLEESVYTVEIEMKRVAAIVRVDAETHDIKEYEIQAKGEESQSFPVSPKSLVMILSISTVVHVILFFTLRMLGF